ncbi:MAG: DUF4296 domain-containing protein [Dysgonomonas sp.]|nr:DUF4296 domain-containing protein [Dysgonomonas sp.]
MIRRQVIYICSFVALTIGIVACSKNDVLSRNKMVAVLHDIQVAEAIQSIRFIDYRERKDKDALIEGVLRQHGITQAQLDSSLVWYSDNVEIYNRVNDSVIATLKREYDKANNDLTRYELITNTRPSSTILPSFSYLTNANPTLDFSIDSVFIQSYPDFKIQFKALWVEDDTDAEFTVSFKYADTTIISSQKLIPTDSVLYQITSPVVQDSTLKRISGYIRLNNFEMTDQKVLLHDIKIRDKIKIEPDTVQVETDSIKNIQ